MLQGNFKNFKRTFVLVCETLRKQKIITNYTLTKYIKNLK